MERIWLGVLYLSGWHISTCLLRQYHYVADQKAWTEAQAYCRKKYTDLVTIQNTEEMNQLANTVSSSGYNSDVWIGLYNTIDWRWSDGYRGSGAEYRNWQSRTNNEPDFSALDQLCVNIGSAGGWWDDSCSIDYPFICYRGTQLDPQFVLVSYRMDWSNAQRYCRENFIDLATVKNDTENQEIRNLVPSEDWVWIGLSRDPNMYWSDGSDYPFSFLSRGSIDITSRSVICGTARQKSGRLWHCESRFPFVCYSVPPPRWHISTCLLRQYHYVADRKTWTEAQAYCREKYTDLATIQNTEEMNQLADTVSSSGYNSDVWIGLYNTIDWRWSDGYRGSGAEYRNWQNRIDNEPDFAALDQLCVNIGSAGGWWDDSCSIAYPFICYRGTQLDPQFVLVSYRMDWSNAQRYCRENFIDLATVKSDTENQEIRNLVPSEDWVWIGLSRDPNMYWSDGSDYPFSFLSRGSVDLTSRSVICGTARQKSGRLRHCESRFPFVCYSVPPPRWHISTCLLRQYHYVADQKAWTEAQAYCRKKYTDLVTIQNTEEMNQLANTVSSSGYNSDIWIGLYSTIDWRWSDGYRGSGAEYRNWQSRTDDEPDVAALDQLCVNIGSAGGWWDDSCSIAYPFICYRGTQLDPQFVLVSDRMNWSNAQRYCRENFIDLATVKNDTENQEIRNLVPSEDWVWIGLSRDPNMYWSDGSDYTCSFLSRGSVDLTSSSVICGTARQKSGRLRHCESRFPFVCYSVPPPPPVMRQVVQLRIEQGDPSVDLNDPAVKANILKKLQDRLKKKGVNGVTLKWREQPDGKVFHKEKKSSRKKTEL